jgi:hypothetical protein
MLQFLPVKSLRISKNVLERTCRGIGSDGRRLASTMHFRVRSVEKRRWLHTTRLVIRSTGEYNANLEFEVIPACAFQGNGRRPLLIWEMPLCGRRQLIFYRPIGDMLDDPNMHLCAHLYATDRNRYVSV